MLLKYLLRNNYGSVFIDITSDLPLQEIDNAALVFVGYLERGSSSYSSQSNRETLPSILPDWEPLPYSFFSPSQDSEFAYVTGLVESLVANYLTWQPHHKPHSPHISGRFETLVRELLALGRL